MEKIAKIISFVLGPFVWFPVLIAIFLSNTGLSGGQLVFLSFSLLFFIIFVPLSYLYFLIKKGEVSDWDIRNRKERYKVLPIFILSTFIAMVTINFYGTKLLFDLYFIFWVIALVAVLVTYFWKISMHMMLNTGACILVNFIFDWKLPYLYVLIPIVGWTRYYLKHHTILQIIAGMFLSFVLVMGLLLYFGYIKIL